MSLKGHRSRRAYRLSDGRVPTKDTTLERQGLQLLRDLGHFPQKDVIVKVPASWTRYDHDIELYPDAVVNVFLDLPLYDRPRLCPKAVLFDGWHYHNRTTRQEDTDTRKDHWYNMAGYFVVHVGDWWFKNAVNLAKLKPLLKAALESADSVVDLAH